MLQLSEIAQKHANIDIATNDRRELVCFHWVGTGSMNAYRELENASGNNFVARQESKNTKHEDDDDDDDFPPISFSISN